MIITGVSDRNVQMVLDLLQLKQLVEVLRSIQHVPYPFVEASEKLIKAGFTMTGEVPHSAVVNFCHVAGYFTDNMVSKEKLEAAKAAQETTQESTTEDGDNTTDVEKLPGPPKPTVH